MRQVRLTQEMSDCIELCRRCQLVCLNMATGHCLEKGGPHAEPEHVKTLLVCAEVCQTAANVIATGSLLRERVCALCADACDACLVSCRRLDDMEECIFACERCKDACEAMTAV